MRLQGIDAGALHPLQVRVWCTLGWDSGTGLGHRSLYRYFISEVTVPISSPSSAAQSYTLSVGGSSPAQLACLHFLNVQVLTSILELDATVRLRDASGPFLPGFMYDLNMSRCVVIELQSLRVSYLKILTCIVQTSSLNGTPRLASLLGPHALLALPTLDLAG